MRRDRFAENKGIVRLVKRQPQSAKNQRGLINLRAKGLAGYKSFRWNLYPRHGSRIFIGDDYKRFRGYIRHIYDV